MCRRIELIGHTPVLGAPLCHTNGEDDVEHQGCERDACKPHVKLHRQDTQDQGHLNQRRYHAIERVRNERFDTSHTALDIARQSSRLPIQMESQTQTM